MSTAIQKSEPTAEVLRDWVQTPDAQREIAAAVGDIMPADQFIAHMLVAFQDEKIRGCTAKSKYRALTECAAMGLLPTLGQVVLIPYEIGNSGVYEVKAMPQWQGFKALMERHPDILEVIGVVVHVDDELSTKEGELRHSYDPFDEGREIQTSKDLRGGYLKIIYRDGRPPKYHMVRRKTIEQAQACAKTQKMWRAWYYEMALKTLYRNAYARRAVPVDPIVGARLERVLKIEDLNLGNDPMRIVSEPSEEHLEQARQRRKLAEHEETRDHICVGEPPPFAPPTAEEQTAAEGPQIDPAVDESQGSDPLPPTDPKSDSDTEEIHLADKITRVRAAGVESLREIIRGNPILTEAAIDRLLAQLEARDSYLLSKSAGRSQPQQEELFDKTASATEGGE